MIYQRMNFMKVVQDLLLKIIGNTFARLIDKKKLFQVFIFQIFSSNESWTKSTQESYRTSCTKHLSIQNLTIWVYVTEVFEKCVKSFSMHFGGILDGLLYKIDAVDGAPLSLLTLVNETLNKIHTLIIIFFSVQEE